MKIIFIISLVTLTLAFNIHDLPSHQQQFEDFQTEFDIHYKSSEEEFKRFQIFSENLRELEEIRRNSDQVGVEYAINQYSDLTQEEFEQNILLPSTPPREFEDFRYMDVPENYLLDGDTPSFWNWTAHGAVTPVQDQGSVGTCWSFSTVENVEGQWFLSGRELVQLSEQQLVECDSSTNSPDADCGVFGGWPYLAMGYIIEIGGLASNEEYRYCVGVKEKENPCYPCSAPGNDVKLCGRELKPPSCDDKKWPCRDKTVPKVAHIDSWAVLSQNEAILMKQVYQIGPISVLMNASGLQWHKKGIYSPKNCNPDKLDHAVLIVGYGTDSETGMDYWIIKNSWGAKWGDEGFFKIERGVGKCGINQQPVTSIIEKAQKTVVEI